MFNTSELISNAADALEKLRHSQAIDPSIDSGKPLEIRLWVDRDKKQFIIQVRHPLKTHTKDEDIDMSILHVRIMVLA